MKPCLPCLWFFLLAAADRPDDLSCSAARCHWRCDAETSLDGEAEMIRCPVSSFGFRQNNFHSPRLASQQDRYRLRFRFKGDLELFALVSDSADEWISIWKSHAQKAHPTHSIFAPGDTNKDPWAATVLLLPSTARALRFTGQGALGDLLADRYADRHESGRRLSWSPWTQVQFSYGPSKRRWHTAVLDAGKMWIFAGDDGELLNDLWYYDTVTLDGWVQASQGNGGNGSWPSPRFSHMAVMQGQQMWVFGGVVQSGLSKELWNYDMEGGNWSGWSDLEGPTARESMTLVEGDGKLWMFGGYDGSIRNDLWCLTTGADPLWTLISTGLLKPSGRYSHVAVQEAGKMWIFGGLTEAGLQADLWYLDISTLIWTEVDVADGPSARESATAASQPGQMWIFGGIDAKNQSDELWLLNLDATTNPPSTPSASDRWRLMDSGSGAGPNGRRYHVAVLDPEGRMWVHNGELWYYATRTSTSSSSSRTTSTTSQSTTLTSTSSTSSSTTSSTNTSTTLTTTSSSTSTTQTSSTTSSSSSSSTSTTLSNTTTTSTTTSTSTSTETSTTSSTSQTTTSSSTTLSTTTSRTTTSSSTTKTSTTTSTSKTSTSSSTTSQTSTTTSTSSSSSETSSTTTTESTTSTSVTKTSITTSWTSTSTSSITSTWTIGNTTTVTFTSTTTQVKSLDLVLTEFLMSKVEEALTTTNASESAVTVIENTSPEAAFTMSMVSFNTHSSRVINESSLPLAVPSFSSSASHPLLASMSIETLQLPGVDLPELGDGVETASGKVRVIAAPLLQIALLDSDFGEAETNLSGLMIFRASKEAVDPASCNFLTDEGWSDEGLHLASREEITSAFGDIDTSGTWCATSHLSVFALLRPCTFLETLQRDGKCFNPPSFGALIGSCCLCLCCSFCGIYTTVKSRHVVGGKMKLSDVEGSSHEVPFQVKRPKRDLEQFDGVADSDSKTLVTWDVERPQTGAAGAAGGNQTLPIAQLMSPKKRLQLNLKTKFFSERSQVQLPRSGTMLSMQSFPDAFEVLPHPEQPSASSHEVPGSYEIYEHREYIEFFSETHQKWTSGSIEGSGFSEPLASDSLPTYHVRLNRQQIRRFIPLERIRPHFQPGDAVTVEVDGEWQPATVQRRQGYPLAYEVQLSSGKQVVSGEKLRARFAKGEAIFAFQGMKTGWVQGVVECESEETWPMILVSHGKDNEAMPIFQFVIRPSAKMGGFSS